MLTLFYGLQVLQCAENNNVRQEEILTPSFVFSRTNTYGTVTLLSNVEYSECGLTVNHNEKIDLVYIGKKS